MFILNQVSKKLLAVASHFLKFLFYFFQKKLSNYQMFSMIFDPKNEWWPPSVFYDFQPKKHLATIKHFLQFLIEKKA
jgi:hypothetical protein